MPHHPEKATPHFILSILEMSEAELQERDLKAQALAEIYDDYLSRQSELTDIAVFIARMMHKAKGVHSVMYRVKEPQHLLRKIIRKKQEYPHRTITTYNYLDLINDLIGVRVLHLYKASWAEIGNYIKSLWELKRPPYAYVKGVKNNPFFHDFTSYGCKVIAHPSGYKAVHFVIETKPAKQRYFAEIQLRTLFEEGWSEIDHNIRYPDHDNSELLNILLQQLNKLTTKADEMATHVRKLTQILQEYKQQDNLDEAALELQEFVEKLPVQEEEKQQLYTCIARITGKGP